MMKNVKHDLVNVHKAGILDSTCISACINEMTKVGIAIFINI